MSTVSSDDSWQDLPGNKMAKKKPKVFLPMCADIIHDGHINILTKAAGRGDVTVLLMTDKAMRSYKREPAMGMDQRTTILKAMSAVKSIMPCEGVQYFVSMVMEHKPDFFIHGDDWKVGPQAAAREAIIFAMKEYGGTVIEPEYTPGVSKIGNCMNEQKLLGILLRTALNDLKRTPAVVARETGMGEALINRILTGREFDSENVAALCRMFATQYPIDQKHLMLNHDTSTSGAWHMSKEESQKSGRVFDRTNANGDTGPYYNYMDTAASALAPFKPELIEMLAQVDNNEPMNPIVVMNKGHLLAQLTFFIGPVNYYCTVHGERQCKVMNTGDSCLITPYVPHSFATRDGLQYSAIVAVTFSTGVRDVLQDLVLHDASKLISIAGDAREPARTRSLRRSRIAELRGLADSDIELILKEAFPEPSKRTPEAEDLVLSKALNVPVHHLVVPELTKENEVTYSYIADGAKGAVGGANKKNVKLPIASAMHMPDAGGYLWNLSEPDTMNCQYFNYIYNYGSTPVLISMESTGAFKQSCALASGDSCVLKPFMTTTMTPMGGDDDDEATLMVAKVSGCVRTDILDELSTFAAEGRKRMSNELDKWW